jgi:hypothetical protein
MKKAECQLTRKEKRGVRCGLRNGQGLYVLAMVLIAVLVATTSSCKKEPTAWEKRVRWDDLKILYTDEQKKDIEKFSDVINSERRIENPDQMLRQMMDEASLSYIRTHLEELSEKPSAKDKPNIHILLDRIEKMRSLVGAEVAEFIREAKENGNTDGLCVALWGLGGGAPNHAKVAEALGSLGDPSAVRVLAVRLAMASVEGPGGVQYDSVRRQLCRVLVPALESCTGLDFSDYDGTEAGGLRVVKRCEEWLEKTGQ